MKSEGNSFCEYVVLKNVDIENRDEGSILDQIYSKQLIFNFYFKDLKFRERLDEINI